MVYHAHIQLGKSVIVNTLKIIKLIIIFKINIYKKTVCCILCYGAYTSNQVQGSRTPNLSIATTDRNLHTLCRSLSAYSTLIASASRRQQIATIGVFSVQHHALNKMKTACGKYNSQQPEQWQLGKQPKSCGGSGKCVNGLASVVIRSLN